MLKIIQAAQAGDPLVQFRGNAGSCLSPATEPAPAEPSIPPPPAKAGPTTRNPADGPGAMEMCSTASPIALGCTGHCRALHGFCSRLLLKGPPIPPPTYGHGVSGDVVLLAVLNHLLQVWAVVRLSICDYNHYSLCPFPATFLKRFRAAIEEMPWAAQPRQPGRRSHCRAPAETAAAAEMRARPPAW